MRYILGSLEPCYEKNPVLWRLFCALTDRPLDQPNYNWLEQDVLNYLTSRGLNHDAGTYESHYGKSKSDQLGLNGNS